MTFPQYKEYMNNNCEWPINTNDCLFFAKKQSLLLRTSTRPPTCKTMHRTPVWLIEHSSTIWWFLTSFEKYITLKQRLNCRRTWVRSKYILVLSSNFAWIMRFLTNYAKSCDLRSMMRNRNIAEYQKPCKVYINFIFTLRCKEHQIP